MTTAALRKPDADVLDIRVQPPTDDGSGKSVIDLRERTRPRSGRVRTFNVTKEGSSVDAAFTVAVEQGRWRGENDDIALKRAFVVANKPTGVAADHFIKWIEAILEDPESLDVPEHHRDTVLEVAKVYANPSGPAVAIPCSWSETTSYLWKIGHEIKRGKRRPVVYRFIGTVMTR